MILRQSKPIDNIYYLLEKMNDVMTIVQSYLCSRYGCVVRELDMAFTCGAVREEFFWERFSEEYPFSYYILEEIKEGNGRMTTRWVEIFGSPKFKVSAPTPFPF